MSFAATIILATSLTHLQVPGAASESHLACREVLVSDLTQSLQVRELVLVLRGRQESLESLKEDLQYYSIVEGYDRSATLPTFETTLIPVNRRAFLLVAKTGTSDIDAAYIKDLNRWICPRLARSGINLHGFEITEGGRTIGGAYNLWNQD